MGARRARALLPPPHASLPHSPHRGPDRPRPEPRQRPHRALARAAGEGADPGVRACVLGAGGTIGPAIARDLASSGEVDELLLLDIDESRAAAVAEGIGSGKVRAAAADASDAVALAAAIEGFDALVNSASYRLNLTVMEACRRAG